MSLDTAVAADLIPSNHDAALRLVPLSVTILDAEHCLVLAGDVKAGGIHWCAPVGGDAEARRVVGEACALHRTWLARDGGSKAPVYTQRKAMGDLLGHAVRFGVAKEVMAAGEGIETVLSLRQALPEVPMVAALSAGHLAALLFPANLRRLYIVRDNDPAGDGARDSLVARAQEVGIEAIPLSPRSGDFNDDLTAGGLDALRAHIRAQLAPEDVGRFLTRDQVARRRG